MRTLLQLANCSDVARDNYRPLSSEEVTHLGGNDLMEIGGHTKSHSWLPSQSPEEQRSEIEGGKVELELMLGKSICAFSYPYGKYNDQSIELVRASGYTSACTTRTAAVRGGIDQFRLPRIWPRSYGGEQLCEFIDDSFIS